MNILTKAEAAAVAQRVEMDLFEAIRNDGELNDMKWLSAMVHAYDKLQGIANEEDITIADAPTEGEPEKKKKGRPPKKDPSPAPQNEQALTQAQKMKAIGLRRKGKTIEEIAQAVDASIDAVTDFLFITTETDEERIMPK